jgi:bacterioferritin (cytochrome b1)
MIDPRISLLARAPDLGQTFNNIQNRLNSRETQQQNTQLFDMKMAQGQQQMQDDRDNRRLRSVAEFSTTDILPNINNPQLLASKLQQRIVMMDNDPNMDSTESREALAQLQSGDIQGLQRDAQASVQLFNMRNGQQQQQASAGTREFQNLLNIAQNPNSTQLEKDSANRQLGNLARVGSSAGERVATNPTLGSQVAEQKGAESTATEQAKSDVKVNEALRIERETQSGRQGVESRRLDIDETKINNEQLKQDAINSKNSRREEADSAVAQVTSLLTGDRFSSAFGRVVTNTPDIAKSKKSIDAIADINQIKGLLTLESRQKLKGQGTISDGEQKILAESATVLNNPLISDERARKELRKIRNVFETASDRNQLKKATKDLPIVIRFDAEGNQIQ